MSAQIEIPAGEAAGQNEPRWVRLRNLIDTYPRDSGILKELIQNADDGEARTVRIVLDERRNPNHPLANHDTFRHLIGPAILAFNDQPFRDQDFINLQNLANSAKIEDAFKTGRFGLGFNSVYNVTDFPILLSGEKLWCLDPCETLLQKPAGGERWGLKQIVGTTFESITSLFEAVGHTVGSHSFNATAIRLPLRTSEHIQFNQEPGDSNHKARISSTPFHAEEFLELVKGLSEIAHEILLFLKNVEAISCERVDASGKPEILLKIELINAAQVRETKGKLNQVLKVGLEGALTAASVAHHGVLDACFEASVLISNQTSQTEQSNWLVSAGLFAGKNNRLVELSRELKNHGERGLPHAAVAICLAKGVQRFPKLAGRVFCYLPIASNEYTGKLPIHIHGAFSLENSRTSLTTHRSDEHGKQKLLAQWNDLLLKEAVARAYASALSHLTTFTGIDLNSEDRAKTIYSLFPPSLSQLSAHHRTLVEQTVRELALRPVFLDVHGTWQPASKLLQFNEDKDLETCLAVEEFVFAAPRVPIHVQNLLREVRQPLTPLTSVDIKEHFKVLEALDCEVGNHPFQGLRNKESIIAVARFLVEQQEDDWTSLPLGLTADGRVRSLSSEDPLIVGTPRQREILSINPHQLVSPEFNKLWDPTEDEVPEGFSIAVPAVWLPLLARHFNGSGDTAAKLCPSDKNLPTTAWLKDVLEELNALPDHAEPEKQLIDSVPLVPDDSGTLHCPGTASTPLLLQLNEKPAGLFLDALGVSYRVLVPQNTLTKPLTAFRDKYERVWSLHPGDLLDSIYESLEELQKEPRAWATRKIVEPLLETLERSWLSEKMAEDKDRLAKLKQLPIFEDSAGGFGVVDETCFSTGQGFTSPKSMGDLRLIRGHACPHVLQSLGVRAFSRRALLEQRLLPHYQKQTPQVRCDWLRWIRDEWNRLIAEFEAGQVDLVALLEDRDLIQTETGSLLAAGVCYNTFERRYIEPVLGDIAAFPDLGIYSDEPKLWIELFERMGMTREPSAQHLADRVVSLVEKVDAEGWNPVYRPQIIATAKYIFDHWHTIAPELVQVLPGTRCPLGDFLRSEPWLPAASGADLHQYLGAQEPEPHLYQASELSPYTSGHIVSSVRPLLPRELHASKDFGISFTPPWDHVAEHFENLLKLAGDDVLSDEALDQFKKPVAEIYRFFGQQESQIARENSFNPIAKRFSCTPCILVPEERRFFLPEDVYRSGGRGLRPIKHVLSSNDSSIEKGLDLLGRRPEPTLEDLSSALIRLAEQQQEVLSSNLQAAVVRCLELIGGKVEDLTEGENHLPDIRVLNRLGFLVPPISVIMLDTSTPTDGLEIGDDEILDQQTPQRVIQLWSIRHSREARVTPVKYEESKDESFLGECRKLELRLKDPAFLAGLARVLYDHQGTVPPGLDWLAKLSVEPCQSLKCNHELTMDGVSRSLGVWPEDCCLHSMPSSSQLLVDQSAFEHDVLLERVADRLATLVSDQGLDNLTPLVKILGCSPASIDKVLTKLGIRSLPTLSPIDEIVVLPPQSDFFTTDEEEPEDMLHDQSYGDPANRTDAEPQDDTEADDYLEQYQHEAESDADSESQEADETEDGEVNGDESEVGLGSGDNDSDLKPRPSNGRQPGNSAKAPSNRSGGEQTPPGRGGQRSSNSNGTLRRMLTGHGDSSTPRPQRPSPGQRQQDGLWISRPAPPKEPPPAVPPPADNQNDEEPINHSIGKAAVGLVITYERSQGRKAQNMAHANPGYDVESRQGRVVERYIEVKGLDGAWGINGVPLSPIQLQLAEEKGDAYWLYVVENARDPDTACIHMIQNPAGKISQFRFDCGWQLAGTTIQTSNLPKPQAGRRIRVFDPDGSNKEGEIVTIDPSGTQLYLRVRYESSAPAKTELYDPFYMQVL